MKSILLSMWLPMLGYIFVATVSVIVALRVDNLLLRSLLVVSAIVSLILAATRIINAKKIGARIKKLEDNQLSVSYDKEDECITIKKGIQ